MILVPSIIGAAQALNHEHHPDFEHNVINKKTAKVINKILWSILPDDTDFLFQTNKRVDTDRYELLREYLGDDRVESLAPQRYSDVLLSFFGARTRQGF